MPVSWIWRTSSCGASQTDTNPADNTTTTGQVLNTVKASSEDWADSLLASLVQVWKSEPSRRGVFPRDGLVITAPPGEPGTVGHRMWWRKRPPVLTHVYRRVAWACSLNPLWSSARCARRSSPHLGWWHFSSCCAVPDHSSERTWCSPWPNCSVSPHWAACGEPTRHRMAGHRDRPGPGVLGHPAEAAAVPVDGAEPNSDAARPR